MPLFTLIIIIFQALVFLGHWFLYKTVIRFFGLHGALALKMIFGVLSVSFITASVLVFKYNKALTNLFYTLSAAWLGAFHFFLWSAFFCWIALWAHKAFFETCSITRVASLRTYVLTSVDRKKNELVALKAYAAKMMTASKEIANNSSVRVNDLFAFCVIESSY